MIRFKDFINEKQADRKYELVGQEGKFWRIMALKNFECVDGRYISSNRLKSNRLKSNRLKSNRLGRSILITQC